MSQSITNINKVNEYKIKSEECKEIQLKKVTRIQFFAFNSDDEFAPVHYKVDFKTTNSIVLQVHGTFASAERYVKTETFGKLDTHVRYQFRSNSGKETFAIAKI